MADQGRQAHSTRPKIEPRYMASDPSEEGLPHGRNFVQLQQRTSTRHLINLMCPLNDRPRDINLQVIQGGNAASMTTSPPVLWLKRGQDPGRPPPALHQHASPSEPWTLKFSNILPLPIRIRNRLSYSLRTQASSVLQPLHVHRSRARQRRSANPPILTARVSTKPPLSAP
jgi:hypothetical protein